MKILVIGNSHAACLIEAWRERQAEHPGVEIDFFARGGAAQDEYLIDGGRLSAPTEAGAAFQAKLGQKAEFEISAYDRIATIGHGLSAFKLVRILNKNHILGWAYRNEHDLPVITETCLRDALADYLHDCNATRILQRLRPAITTEQQLFALPQPYPSEVVLDGPAKAVGFVRLCRAGIAKASQHLYEKVAAAHLKALGATFLPQPGETVAEGVLTARRFTLGANCLYDLNQPQPPQDELHANSAYGGLLLRQILRKDT